MVWRLEGREVGRSGGLEQGTPISGPRRRSKRPMEEGKEVSWGQPEAGQEAAGLIGGQVKLSLT